MTITQSELFQLDQLRDEDIQKLKELEAELYSAINQSWLEDPANGTQEQKDNFTDKRLDLSIFIKKLDAIRIKKIADKFKANESELKQGIDDISTTISSVSSSINTVNQIGILISTITKILF